MPLIRTAALACLSLLACSISLLAGSTSHAQEWAKKMFDVTEHRFGVVARGAKVEHRFTITNLYEEDVHISGVRSSCGCTTPSVTRDTLKTFEKGELVAVFNTRAFHGDKSATLTVTFDKPFYAQVQVNISGHIRTDVVLRPGSVDLGSVALGTAVEKVIAITYAGRNDWQLLDVQTASPHLSAELIETSRGGGQVGYNMIVRLAEDAPVGYIEDQMLLVTNDAKDRQIPVDVEGRVEADVSVSPTSLFMGVLQPGQKVTKQIVVRAGKPFKITGVSCDDASFSFQAPDTSKDLHLIPVTFTAGDTPGKLSQQVRIETDLGEGAVPELTVHAQVVEP